MATGELTGAAAPAAATPPNVQRSQRKKGLVRWSRALSATLAAKPTRGSRDGSGAISSRAETSRSRSRRHSAQADRCASASSRSRGERAPESSA
jgi:hypothetical protein